MKNPSTRHAQQAAATIERAKELCETKPCHSGDLSWFVEALHVGDLSVLALALTK
jgi:hypothetical protein